MSVMSVVCVVCGIRECTWHPVPMTPSALHLSLNLCDLDETLSTTPLSPHAPNQSLRSCWAGMPQHFSNPVSSPSFASPSGGRTLFPQPNLSIPLIKTHTHTYT